MNIKITAFAVILTCLCALTSCLKDDADNASYNDAAITSVSLGSVKCERNGESYTYSAASYYVRINQITDVIYNTDSLSVGTVLSSVPVTINTCNAGTLMLKNRWDDNFRAFNSGDTIDCSDVRVMRVISQDGTRSRDYKLNITAHKQHPDDFVWEEQSVIGFDGAYTTMKALSTGGRFYVLGQKSDGSYEVKTSTDATEWTAVDMQNVVLGDTLTMANLGNTVLVCNGDKIYKASNGAAFEEMQTSLPAGVSIKALLGEASGCVYAISKEGQMLKGNLTAVPLLEWTPEEMLLVGSDAKEYLPYEDICFVAKALGANAGTDDKGSTATVIANKKNILAHEAAKPLAVIWNKTIDVDLGAQPWVNNRTAWSNKNWVLPRMKHLSAAAYADYIYAIGGDSPAQIYYSPDHGTSWHTQARMVLPQGFASTNGAVLCSDGGQFVYLMATGSGKIWRGHVNKMTWQNNDNYHEK